MPDEPAKEGTYSNYEDKSRRTRKSINGRYSVGENYNDFGPYVRRLFYNFMYKAIHHGQPMNKNSPALHSQGRLKYMRHYLGVDLQTRYIDQISDDPRIVARGLLTFISASISVKSGSKAPMRWPGFLSF
jgi:hypothetical protein